MLSLKDLGDIKDILHWARMQAKTDGMYQRIVYREKQIETEELELLTQKKYVEERSYISRDVLKALVRLASYPDFKLNIEITGIGIIDDKEIGIAVRTVLLNVIKSAVELREQL